MNYIGETKLVMTRAREYIGWVQFLVIMYTSIVLTNLNLTIVLAIIPAGLIFLYIDRKYVIPRQFEATTEKNPVWLEIRQNTRKILKEMKKQ